MKSSLNKFEHVFGGTCTGARAGALYRGGDPVGNSDMEPPCGQTGTTEDITFLQLRLQAVIIHFFCHRMR